MICKNSSLVSEQVKGNQNSWINHLRVVRVRLSLDKVRVAVAWLVAFLFEDYLKFLRRERERERERENLCWILKKSWKMIVVRFASSFSFSSAPSGKRGKHFWKEHPSFVSFLTISKSKYDFCCQDDPCDLVVVVEVFVIGGSVVREREERSEQTSRSWAF